MTTTKLPLAGIRITDMTLVLAGTGAASLLADWGAEVIRVEPLQVMQPNTRGTSMARPQQEIVQRNRVWGWAYPDWTPGPRPWNEYPYYHAHGRNKMSMTLDVRTPEGKDVLRTLVGISDVVMENNAPDTIERMGVTYEVLRKWKPDLIMLRMPAYGLSGPYKYYRSFGSQLEGAAGHTFMRGYPDCDPTMTHDIYHGDAVSAVMGAVALSIALRQWKRTGKGRLIEQAQVESLIPMFAEALLAYQMTGRSAEPQGNDVYDYAPHNAYPCRAEDSWVAIAVRDDQEWQGLVKALRDPAWARDPRFATQAGRFEHRRELDALVAEWTKQFDNRWVMERLQKHGVPAGAMNDDRDHLWDPQLRVRGFFERLTHAETGPNWYPGIVWKMEHTPNAIRFPPATLGQHNAFAYRDLLGFSADRIEALTKKGHIGTDYPAHVR